MLRDNIKETYRSAAKQQNQRIVSTLRLILTAIKDRDNAVQSHGTEGYIDDNEILSMLHTMIQQRCQSIDLYEQEGRLDLVEEEKEEIDIIQNLIPPKLDEQQTRVEVEKIVHDIGADNVKDFRRTMAELHRRYPHQIQSKLACSIVKQVLT